MKTLMCHLLCDHYKQTLLSKLICDIFLTQIIIYNLSAKADCYHQHFDSTQNHHKDCERQLDSLILWFPYLLSYSYAPSRYQGWLNYSITTHSWVGLTQKSEKRKPFILIPHDLQEPESVNDGLSVQQHLSLTRKEINDQTKLQVQCMVWNNVMQVRCCAFVSIWQQITHYYSQANQMKFSNGELESIHSRIHYQTVTSLLPLRLLSLCRRDMHAWSRMLHCHENEQFADTKDIHLILSFADSYRIVTYCFKCTHIAAVCSIYAIQIYIYISVCCIEELIDFSDRASAYILIGKWYGFDGRN